MAKVANGSVGRVGGPVAVLLRPPPTPPAPAPYASRATVLHTETVPTITATVQAEFWPPRVLVTVTGLATYPVDHITIYRQVAGVRTVLRGANNVVLGGSDGFVRTDAELPFAVPVTYVAALTAGALSFEITAAPVTAAIAKVALTDAINGNAAQVVIIAWPEKTSPRPSSTYQVGGRVVVVSSPRAATPASALEVMTETDSARENLDTLLGTATSGVIQLRSEDPIKYGDVDAYLAVTEDRRERWSQDGSDQRRRWTLTVQEVEAWPVGLEAGGFTLQDLNDAYPVSLQQIADSFATLLDIAVADLS